MKSKKKDNLIICGKKWGRERDSEVNETWHSRRQGEMSVLIKNFRTHKPQ